MAELVALIFWIIVAICLAGTGFIYIVGQCIETYFQAKERFVERLVRKGRKEQ